MQGLSEDDALEAKRRYYALKVSGNGRKINDDLDTSYVPLREQEIDEFGRSYGTGKRKTSVARVWIKDGSGVFVVNERRLIDYFPPIQRESCLGSFVASKTIGLFDVWCTVKGGGQSGNQLRFTWSVRQVCNIYQRCMIFCTCHIHQGKLVLFDWVLLEHLRHTIHF